jgi:hypothetical protein
MAAIEAQLTVPDITHIYIDESSQTDNRYQGLGAVVVPVKQVGALEHALTKQGCRNFPSLQQPGRWRQGGRSCAAWDR